MFDSMFLWIGIVVIIFIICVSLLIFAPKSINYYNVDTFPIVKYLHENNLQLIKDGCGKAKEDRNWLKWNIDIIGKCDLYPLYMFSISPKKRQQTCVDVYNLMKNIPDVKTCSYVILHPKSKISKNRGWKSLSNNTLRCLIIINAPISTVDKCGIWVNGESKILKPNDLLIFDSSKEHSIYNKTSLNIEYLMIDIKRPEKIVNGTSDREYSDKLYEFINNLSLE